MNKYIELIRSEAIRKYLYEINYEPSTSHAAHIIYRNKNLLLKEKHELWNEIIDTMPDEKLNNKKFKYNTDSFHKFLKKYMEIQNRLCEQFFSEEENVVYTCSSGVVINPENGIPIIKNPFYWCNIYTDLTLCIEDAHEKKYPTFDIRKHYIKTNTDDTDFRSIWADISQNREILDIGEIFILSKEDSEILLAFNTETAAIPVPFKKGDLVYSPNCDNSDIQIMIFNNYKNGMLCVKGFSNIEEKSFHIINELDLEFASSAINGFVT